MPSPGREGPSVKRSHSPGAGGRCLCEKRMEPGRRSQAAGTSRRQGQRGHMGPSPRVPGLGVCHQDPFPTLTHPPMRVPCPEQPELLPMGCQLAPPPRYNASVVRVVCVIVCVLCIALWSLIWMPWLCVSCVWHPGPWFGYHIYPRFLPWAVVAVDSVVGCERPRVRC